MYSEKNKLLRLFGSNQLFLIILLAFIIRMAFFIALQPWNKDIVENTIIVSDASDYNKLALNLLSNGSFSYFGTFRTPGYPVFIAIIYSISSESIWLVLLVQIILNLISAYLVYKIALLFFSQEIALLSALLFAFDFHQALYAVGLLTDSLFVFLFLASVYFLCKSIKRNKFILILFSALFIGLAALVRPIVYYFPIVAIIFILAFSGLILKHRIKYSLFFIIIFMATISPWLIRNYSNYGEAQLCSYTGDNLLFYDAAYTEMYKTGKTIDQVRKDFYNLATKLGMDKTDTSSFKNSKLFVNMAEKYIKNNFILFCKRSFMGIINMYSGITTMNIASVFHIKSKPLHIDQYGGSDIWSRIIDFFDSKTKEEILIAFGIGFYLLLNYVFAFYGIFVELRRKENFIYLFILIILFFSILTGVVGSARFRIPFMPIINILCAVGIYNFLTNRVKLVDRFKFYNRNYTLIKH